MELRHQRRHDAFLRASPSRFRRRRSTSASITRSARHRQFTQVDADGVGDRIDQSRRESGERAFARFLGAERAVGVVAFHDLDFDRRGFGARRNPIFEQACMYRQALGVAGFLA